MLPKKYALYFLLLLFVIFSFTAILFIRSNLKHKRNRQQQQQENTSSGGSGGNNVVIEQQPLPAEEKLRLQQERDDFLLQREREKMEKERKEMNKEPVVIVKIENQSQQQQVPNDEQPQQPQQQQQLQKQQVITRKLIDAYHDQLIVKDETMVVNNDSEQQQQQQLMITKICRNTVSGHDLITDSKGYTCPVSKLNTRTMCCSTMIDDENTSDDENVKRYSCDTCHSRYQCCEVYEYCVSCCLKPENRSQLEKLYSKYLSENKLLYTRIHTIFQFCSTRCRTNSNSVVNENKYRTMQKHCFGYKDPVDITSSSATSAT